MTGGTSLLQNKKMEARKYVEKYLDEVAFDFYLVDGNWLKENLGKVYLVDVRMPREFSECHIPGATNMPLKKLARHMDEFPKEKDIVFYCASGAMSAQAVVLMRLMGYRAYGLLGGIKGWKEAGFPVEGANETRGEKNE